MSGNIEKEQGESPVSPTEAPEKKKREYKDFGHEEAKATRKCWLDKCLERDY